MPAVRPPTEGGAPQPTLGTNTPSELTRGIVTVEKASNRLLPSSVTAALAQSGLDEKTLTRAAQIVAKNFDLDPVYFWGTSTPTDPYTGGPLSLATFRRLTEDAKPAVLEAMAPTLFRPQSTDERVMERPWLTQMNAQKVSTILRAVGPVLAPYHIAAHEGIALADQIAKRGVSAKRFAANLKAVLDWYAVDQNTLMKGRELDWVALANLALEASEAKQTLATAMDVRAFLYPEIATQARQATAAEANAAAADSWAMYGGGKGTAWLNTATDLTPVARAFLAGDYADAEVKKFLDEKFGNAEELAKAREVLVKQALIEKAREAEREGNLLVAGLTGGRGGVNIPDAEGLAEAKELLSRGSPDWYKGAELLRQEVVDSKTAFQRSFVGQTIGAAAGIVMGLYEATQLGIVNLAALSVPVLEAVGEKEMANDYATTYAQYRQRIKAGGGVFDTMGKRLGWHPAVGTSLDFLVSWYLDPTIIASKSLMAYRGLKFAPGLVEKRTFVEAAVAKVPGFENYISKRVAARVARQRLDFLGSIAKFSSRNADELAKALASGDPGAVRRFIEKFGTHIETGTALDEALLQKAQRYFTERYPIVTQDSVKEAEHLLQSLFGVRVRPGSVAEAAWMTRASAETKALTVADQMPTIQGRVYAQSETGLLVPEATAKDLVDDAIRQHVLNVGQLEVPYRYRPIPGFGLKQSVTNALRGSDVVNEGALAGIQRAVAQTLGLNPGNVLNLNDDPARWARLVAVRSGEFGPREVDSIVDAMNKAAIGGNPEAAVREVVDKRIIEPVLKAEATRRGLPDAYLPALKEELDTAIGRWRQELFGVVDGKNVRTPLLETQRVNELIFPDVLQVKKFVRTWGMAHRDFLESAPREMWQYLASAQAAWDRVTPLFRSIMRGWKTLVVPRGGYVGRVVLLDEGLGRWFGTGFSVLERAAATNVDDAVAAVVKAGTLSLTPKPAARLIGKAVGKPVEAVSDWLYHVDEFRFGDDVVRLEVPRTSIGYEPLANTTARQSEVIEDLMKRSAQVQKDLKFRGQWGIVEPKNATYYPALSHALNNQIGQSIPGRLALEAVRDGKSVVETQALLLSWARRNGRSYLAQMGWAAEDAEEWAALLSKMVHGYTVGSKEVAALALERGITDDILRKIPRDSLPNIHGPLLQEATFGGGNQLSRLTEYWYDTFVRLPENTLNRQPYYRAWKRRAERAYYAMAESQHGAGLSLLDDELRALGFSSMDDALERTATRVIALDSSDDIARTLQREMPNMHPDRLGAHTDVDALARAKYGDDVVYRGMSRTEFDQAQKDGFFRSLGVQKAREGDTFVATNMSGAAGYARWEYSARFGRRLPNWGSREDRVVVVLRKPKNLREVSPLESVAREPVPFDDVVGAYQVTAAPVRSDAAAAARLRQEAAEAWEFYPQARQGFPENVADLTDEQVLEYWSRLQLETQLESGGYEGAVKNLADNFAFDEETSLDDIIGMLAEDAGTTPQNYLIKSARRYAGKTMADYAVAPISELRFPHALAEQVTKLSAEARAALVPLDELKAAIDQASRDFALKQVKRIMFDFSENSRLGELLYGVFPFLQPYTEAFSVYGHILWHRNPALVGYANRLWDVGKASGFIRKDEQTGEWVIPTSWWSGASTALQMVAGVTGAQTLTPVRSLNLFASSAIRLPDDFPLIGGASIPVPSASPPALFVLQQLFKDTESDALASWLFAYGPNVQMVPTSLNKFLQATFPEMYDDGLLNSLAMDYLIDYQYRGVYQDLKPEALKAQALEDAKKHMQVRAFLSFNGIGVNLVRWEWAPIRQEYFDLIDKYGGDTQKAREEFLTKYPEFSAMTVGKTQVGPGLAFVDENGSLIPEATGLRLPATDYARRFLNSPAGKELVAQGFTPLLGALLLQMDGDQQTDFATYSQYISQGLVKTKDLIEYIADVEQAGLAGSNPRVVEEHEGFWGAIVTFNESQRVLKDNLRAQGFKEGDEAFAALDRQEDDFLLSLRDHFPASFKSFFTVEVSETDPSEITRVSWRFGTNGSGEPDPVVLAKIRQFAAIPQIQNFPAVKGLNYYLPELDRIRARMIQEGIDSIEDAGAIELGLDKEYEKVLATLESNPDYAGAAYIVNNFLRNVLTSEPTQGELTLRDWQKSGDPRYAAYQSFEEEYRSITDQIDAVQLDHEKSLLYTRILQLFSRQYRENPDIIEAWWNKKSYGERAQYRDGLITKYVGYMNQWDLHLLGIDVSDTTAAQIATVAGQRSAVGAAKYQATLEGRDFDTKAAYEPIEKMEMAFAMSNPEYARVLNAQRTWGYALESSEYVQGEHRAAYLWRNVVSLIHATQNWATSQGLTGTVYGSQADKTEYLRRRAVLIAVVNGYKQEDSRFAKEWGYLEAQVTDPLINYFMPDYYFDYPLGPVSPRQAA